MKTLVLRVLLLACLPVTAATAQRRPRELPAPAGLTVAGDTTRVGVVSGVDPNARYLNLTLRLPGRVEVYAMDRTGLMHQMVSCYLDSGTTTVRPTLTETISNSATFQTGSSFGNSSAGRGAPRQMAVWRFASSQEQLLIMLMLEEPTSRRGCDQSGSGAAATFGLMRPAEALNSLPPTLLRFPETPWAAFLVQP